MKFCLSKGCRLIVVRAVTWWLSHGIAKKGKKGKVG